MSRQYVGGIVTGVLMVLCLFLGFLLARMDSNVFGQQSTPTPPASNTPALEPSETFPPSSPLPSLTPSQTLKPPPTFEPPTATLPPSLTPSPTPTVALRLDLPPPEGIQGFPTATTEVTQEAECEKREDWKLTYTVQAGDALERIANLYSTYSNVIAEGNCLDSANVIYQGQVLRVPGDAQPEVARYECKTWEALTPFNGAYTVPGEGDVSFNWRGPLSERYLVRVIMPSGKIFEKLVEMQQNAILTIQADLPETGVHTWYVYPLGMDFLQIPCLEGGPWTFHKGESPALTWTPSSTPTSTNTPEPWAQTATAKAFP